jgi:methionyl-tRNA formyltransferase
LKLIFAGTPENAARTLEEILKSEHQVVGVITRPDSPVGRKQISTSSPVAKIAEAHNLPLLKTKNISPDEIGIVKQWGADLGLVVAYGSIFRKEVLDLPKQGWINIHYSLLPIWPGAAPVQNAIMNGDTRTGVTIFKLDEGMDTGLVAKQVAIDILEDETSGELLSRLTSLGISAVREVLMAFESGNQVLLAQDKGIQRVTASKPSREIAKINWASNSEVIHNLVRAMNPEPMAWCLYDGNPLRVISSRLATDKIVSADVVSPGSVVVVDRQVLVHCGENSVLELIQIQPAGKKPMRTFDWINGLTTRNVVLN